MSEDQDRQGFKGGILELDVKIKGYEMPGGWKRYLDEHESDEDMRDALSYLALRRAVGAVAFLLPVALVVGDRLLFGGPVLGSISAYYGTGVRDVFVGSLASVSVFLACYGGYDARDRACAGVGSVAAAAVALFPCTAAAPWVRAVHYGGASVLFATLAVFSLFLFTRSAGGWRTESKVARDRVYVACGLTIVGGMVADLVCYALGWTAGPAHPALWLESVMLWAFGISWAIKGEVMLADVEDEAVVRD